MNHRISLSMSTNTSDTGPYIYAGNDRVQLRTGFGMGAPVFDLSSDKALIRATSNAVIELKNSECAITAGKLTINGTDLLEFINNNIKIYD